MADEKEGPYKVVQKLVGYRESLQYAIVKQEKNDVFLQELIPNVGTGETARIVCNLLNKEHKRRLEVEREQADGADGSGVPDSDQ